MAYEIDEAKELVIKAGKELLKSGLIARTWGNISARISAEQFVVTPSGRSYENLTPEEIVVVNISDCSHEGDVKPSSEKGVHAEGYRLRKDVNFIIHTHQNNASALSIMGSPITDVSSYGKEYEKILGAVIPCAQYGLSSTKKLKKNVSKAIEDHPDSRAVLMKYHGAVALGTDYENAFSVANMLEEVSGMVYERLAGESVPEVSDLSEYWTLLEDEKMSSYRFLINGSQRAAGVFSSSPYIKKMSGYLKTMKPYLDDLAQIAGTSISCVAQDASQKEISDALKSSMAVMIQGKGALCFGINPSEAEAVAMVLEKGAQAAYLANVIGRISPVDPASALLEHKIYVAKYSKLK
ncbi:MAG: class II aldolase/adducin family protein [Lachnospiraceae bacterium]|nr:class II aldolase/adducin family protein [Lachnospiraceae bacterium]